MYITTEKINGKTRAIVLSNKNELVKVLEERIIDGKKYIKIPSYLLAMINRDEYGIEYDKEYYSDGELKPREDIMFLIKLKTFGELAKIPVINN